MIAKREIMQLDVVDGAIEALDPPVTRDSDQGSTYRSQNSQPEKFLFQRQFVHGRTRWLPVEAAGKADTDEPVCPGSVMHPDAVAHIGLEVSVELIGQTAV